MPRAGPWAGRGGPPSADTGSSVKIRGLGNVHDDASSLARNLAVPRHRVISSADGEAVTGRCGG